MTLSAAQLFAALEATWPPAARHACGPFTLREGKGGGKRVSAATLDGNLDDVALEDAAAGMLGLGQTPLFMVRSGQAALDAALDARGYDLVDPSLFYAARIAAIAEAPRPVALLPCWPPLAIQRQLWLDAGIGPERVAVMQRACAPRNAFIARFQNRAAGVGFVAVHDGIAMLHALEVEPGFRRQGVARYMVRGIAHWAAGQGADWLALAVTERNMAARALYSALNMTEAEGYHYRSSPKDRP